MRVLILLCGLLPLSFICAQQDEPSPKPEHWQVIERLIEQHDQQEAGGVVFEHMAGISDRRKVAHTLSRVKRALAQPWTPPELARELRDLLSKPLAASAAPELEELWPAIADYCDMQLADPDEMGILDELDLQWDDLQRAELKGRELLEALSEFLFTAHQAMDESLADLDADQRELLFQGHRLFREGWYRSHFPGSEAIPEQQQMVAAWTKLLASSDYAHNKALAVAQRVARLTSPAFIKTLPRRLNRLRKRIRVEGHTGDVRAMVGDEAASRVVLGGSKSATYSAPAALIIDLGGDDHYRRAAVVDNPEALVSIVIDLGGADVYGLASGEEPSEEVQGPCTATGGFALLYDHAGHDQYRSGRLAQGAASLGVACLIDVEGDDVYEMEDYGQGHATGGTALLYDCAGDDRYTAWAFAQGGGLARSFSALVDAGGNDEYLADLVWPDVYGNSGPEIYHGASQGYCTGIRSGQHVAGGVGALVDLGDGEDRYQSGNFSQGGAYYFSFALMFDGGGDDQNFGTRYSQGFGVHQAAAVRWDAGGDDSYTCRSVAHAGMAWDEGVGYLLEDGGDDTYQLGDLALGGAAMTGVAICIDRGGADHYVSGRSGQGGAGGDSYHNKPALGVLIDLGGAKDSYSAEGRANNAVRVTEGVELFIDAKAQTLTELLRKLR